MKLLRPALTPMRAWLLAVLLLAAQAAGLAHRLQHAQLALAPGPVAGQVQGLKPATLAEPGSFKQSLGEHQPGSADCRLLDHLMHAGVLCSDSVAAAVAPLPADTAAEPPALALPAAGPALYLARAPPLA